MTPLVLPDLTLELADAVRADFDRYGMGYLKQDMTWRARDVADYVIAQTIRPVIIAAYNTEMTRLLATGTHRHQQHKEKTRP